MGCCGWSAMIDGDAYRRDGYLLLRGFLDPGRVTRVRDEAQRIFISQMRRLGLVASDQLTEREFEHGMYDLFEVDLQTFMDCGKQAQHLISLHRLSLDERIVDVLKELGLTFPNISTRPVMFFNSPRLAKKEVYWRVFPH